jgi:hypothetical protein
MARCSLKVIDKIDEAERLDAAGECWCECLKRDVPNARRLVEEGKCGAANSVIEAALRRCNRKGLEGRLAAVTFQPEVFTPITGKE